jgi:hypothetical protein
VQTCVEAAPREELSPTSFAAEQQRQDPAAIARIRSTRSESDDERTPARRPSWRPGPSIPVSLRTVRVELPHLTWVKPRERPRTHTWAKPYSAGPHGARTAPNVPRRTQTSMWAKPCLAARPTTRAPIYTFRERSRTQAWAKPCLAGRPTALVRTLPPEQNTSRGRPPGMELPDYPVVVLTPTPWDQDGPALHYPAGSFPVLVTRSAAHRSCSSSSSSSSSQPSPTVA